MEKPLYDRTVSIFISEVLEAFFLSLIPIFLMELGDKTQLTAFALTLRFRSPLRVFLGIIVGLSGTTLIAIILGLLIKNTIDFSLLKPMIGFLFILGGFMFLFLEIIRGKKPQISICPVSLDKCPESRENCPEMDRCDHFLDTTVRKGAFLNSSILIFLAELGDKTMLMGMGLSTQLNPIGVFLGALSALIIVNGIGVFAGDSISKILPRKTLTMISGSLFILIGIFLLLLH